MVESWLPSPQNEPQFLQIYFVGEDDREVQLRYNNFLYVRPGLVRQLQRILHTHNVYVREFKLALDKCDLKTKQPLKKWYLLQVFILTV
ncbi:unnamed protein product [Parnassius mnemosyne]|uniref:Uncharacterized protein n=1 Tax=Parnassius mnemosyne TaxID=213953 RepID=A0AAV1M1B3_9NEOP